jgi:hypothetical protein
MHPSALEKSDFRRPSRLGLADTMGRGRYQIVREHAPSRMIIEDTGLGIKRTPNMLVLQVTIRPPAQSLHDAGVL